MSLVHAKCTNCGANLQVDNAKDAAICEYCGSAYIVEKAINNYNTVNNIQAQVVNIYGGNSADFVIRGGVLEKYNGASTHVVIPNTVHCIGKDAFMSTYVESVAIPDGVKAIEDRAFTGCRELRKIEIPNSVTSIGERAFCRCSSLTSVTISLPSKLSYIGEYAFSGCTNLRTINVPRSVRNIGNWAFSSCHNLMDASFEDLETEKRFYQDVYAQREADKREEERIQREKEKKEMDEQRLRMYRRQAGVCEECGGGFKGLFTRICTKCGAEKQY